MIFAARHKSYSRLDSSPVASGWSRSCSMMKRSIVMTEVDVCTLAISREGDSAYLVRSENLTAPTPQPAEHLGGRMAVMIVRAHADHGFARPQLAEPRVRRRAQRAVMPDLEQLHPADPPREVTHRRQPAQVIGIAVRRHDQRQPPAAVPPQKRDHHAPPRVAPGNPRPPIDHDPAAVGCTEDRRIALTDVQEKYSQATAIVERDDVTKGRRDENRGQK